MFPGREAAKEIARYVADLDGALSLAIHLENTTVEYYRKLHDACTHEAGRRAFARLVEEEKKHAARLEEARAALPARG
jgi:rubrerythrin